MQGQMKGWEEEEEEEEEEQRAEPIQTIQKRKTGVGKMNW